MGAMSERRRHSPFRLAMIVSKHRRLEVVGVEVLVPGFRRLVSEVEGFSRKERNAYFLSGALTANLSHQKQWILGGGPVSSRDLFQDVTYFARCLRDVLFAKSGKA